MKLSKPIFLGLQHLDFYFRTSSHNQWRWLKLLGDWSINGSDLWKQGNFVEGLSYFENFCEVLLKIGCSLATPTAGFHTTLFWNFCESTKSWSRICYFKWDACFGPTFHQNFVYPLINSTSSRCAGFGPAFHRSLLNPPRSSNTGTYMALSSAVWRKNNRSSPKKKKSLPASSRQLVTNPSITSGV